MESNETVLRYAIIGGLGVFRVPWVNVAGEVVETQYGNALVYRGTSEYEQLIFLNRHGKPFNPFSQSEL